MENVTSLFKKGRRQKAENCRPVCAIAVIGKKLESIMKEVVTSQRILIQSGRVNMVFMKRKLRLANLLEFFEDVTSRAIKENQ